MSLQATTVLREDWEVGSRLKRLGLDKTKLLTVRNIAVGAAADATPYHPANAAGTFAYQHGTFGLRINFVDEKEWKADRPNGVEAIVNNRLRIRVVFANVDIACEDEHEPKGRSDRGAGAERLCAGNSLFQNLPRFVNVDPLSSDGWTTFYLMVSPKGAAELTCAKVVNGQFSNFIERIYLSNGSDVEPDIRRSADEGEAQNFEPQISRK
jgi:hypothetical protein